MLKVKQFVKFLDMIEIELCKFGHKLTKRTLPKPLRDLMDQREGKKRHRCNTRCKSKPNVQSHQSTIFNQNFLCKSITEFNKLPTNVKNSQGNCFTKKLKHHFLGRWLTGTTIIPDHNIEMVLTGTLRWIYGTGKWWQLPKWYSIKCYSD